MLRPLMPPPTTTQSTEYGSAPASALDGEKVDCFATEHRKVGRRRRKNFGEEGRKEEESRPLILAGKKGREAKGRRSVRVAAIAEREREENPPSHKTHKR